MSSSYTTSLRPLGAQVRLLLLRFLLSFVLYSICRGIFYLYNQDLLEVGSTSDLGLMFWGGLRFDLSAIVYTSLLLTVLSLLPLPQAYSRGYQRLLTGIYRVITSIAIVLNLGDVLQFGAHADDPPERVPLGKLDLITIVVRLCLKGCVHRRTILSGPDDNSQLQYSPRATITAGPVNQASSPSKVTVRSPPRTRTWIGPSNPLRSR